MKKIYVLTIALLLGACGSYDSENNGNQSYVGDGSNSGSSVDEFGETNSYGDTNVATYNSQMHASVMDAPLATYKIGNPYNIDNMTFTPGEDFAYKAEGVASWYGNEFAGQKTANGEVFNNSYYTAAHKSLPMPSVVKITNLDNGKTTYARVNDRGPFTKSRLIDVSEAVASELEFKEKGSANVRVELMPNESAVLKNKAMASGGVASTATAMTTATTQTTSTASSTYTPGAYEVQAGAMNTKESAEALAYKISSVGNIKIISEGEFFKVRYGPYATKDEAKKVRDELNKLGVNPGLIVNGKWQSWD